MCPNWQDTNRRNPKGQNPSLKGRSSNTYWDMPIPKKPNPNLHQQPPQASPPLPPNNLLPIAVKHTRLIQDTNPLGDNIAASHLKTHYTVRHTKNTQE